MNSNNTTLSLQWYRRTLLIHDKQILGQTQHTQRTSTTIQTQLSLLQEFSETPHLLSNSWYIHKYSLREVLLVDFYKRMYPTWPFHFTLEFTLLVAIKTKRFSRITHCNLCQQTLHSSNPFNDYTLSLHTWQPLSTCDGSTVSLTGQLQVQNTTNTSIALLRSTHTDPSNCLNRQTTLSTTTRILAQLKSIHVLSTTGLQFH